MQQKDKLCCDKQSSLSCRKVHNNYNNAIIQSNHYFPHKKCIGTHNNTIHNNPSTYPYNPTPLRPYLCIIIYNILYTRLVIVLK